jgi:hypothetical protein
MKGDAMMTRPTRSLALLALLLLPARAMAQHVLPPPEPPFQGTSGRDEHMPLAKRL